MGSGRPRSSELNTPRSSPARATERDRDPQLAQQPCRTQPSQSDKQTRRQWGCQLDLQPGLGRNESTREEDERRACATPAPLQAWT